MIFAIGLLIDSIPWMNKVIYIALSMGDHRRGRLLHAGAPFDIAYFASGMCGLVMLIKYQRETFGWIKAALRSNRPKGRGRRLKIYVKQRR